MSSNSSINTGLAPLEVTICRSCSDVTAELSPIEVRFHFEVAQLVSTLTSVQHRLLASILSSAVEVT
jgi:hypothetical protein